MERQGLKAGDRVKIKCATRSGWVRGWRGVTGVLSNGGVTVTRAHGWKDFIVHPHEIIDYEVREA